MMYSSKIMQRGWHGWVLSPGSVWRDKDEVCAPDSQSWSNKESHGKEREADTQGSRSGIWSSVSSLCCSIPPCTAGPHCNLHFSITRQLKAPRVWAWAGGEAGWQHTGAVRCTHCRTPVSQGHGDETQTEWNSASWQLMRSWQLCNRHQK